MLPTTSEVLAGGARVRVCRLGGGAGEPLVLLHGYPDTLQIWGRLAPLLARGRPVIACDWPGQGASDAWPGGTTPTHQAGRLRQLLDHWGVARASVLGMDMGAQPALALAALHPERVGRLVVMNSLVLWDEATSWEIRVLRRFGWNRWLLARAPRLVFARALRTSLPRGQPLPAAVRADLWSCFREPAVRAFTARLCAGYQGTLPALPALYRAITRPTLILWGDRDRHFPPAHAHRLHALVPGSRLQIVPRGEHWMAWHLAEVLAPAIADFLELASAR